MRDFGTNSLRFNYGESLAQVTLKSGYRLILIVAYQKKGFTN